jgi:CrcB protein
VSEHPSDGDEPVVPIDPDVDRSDRPRASRARPRVLLAVAAGGALGAPARYEVAQIIHVAKDTFPWATFVTNVSGSFALGFLLILVIDRFPPTRYVQPFFATGFLGAFTTFSTFAVESDLLIKDGHAGIGIVYALASLAAGFVAVWAGILLGRLGHAGKPAAS